MQVSAEIGQRREFVLKRALLIYEDQVSKRDQFATVHEIVREGALLDPDAAHGTISTCFPAAHCT